MEAAIGGAGRHAHRGEKPRTFGDTRGGRKGGKIVLHPFLEASEKREKGGLPARRQSKEAKTVQFRIHQNPTR